MNKYRLKNYVLNFFMKDPERSTRTFNVQKGLICKVKSFHISIEKNEIKTS